MEFLARGLGFGVSVAFWPSIPGAAYSPRWALVALALPFITWPSVLFSAYCFVVLDFDSAVKWTLIAAAFSMGAWVRDLRSVALAFAFGMLLNGVIAAAQVFGWDALPQQAAPGGLFINKNLMGEAAAIVIILAITIKDWQIVRWAAPALMLSACRGAWLAVGVALCARIARWQAWLGLVGAVALGFVLFDKASLVERLTFWRLGMSDLSWFGSGFNPVVPLHNEWLQVVHDLGLGSVFVFLVLARVGVRSPVFALGVVALGTFGFMLHVPATAWLAAVACGHVVEHFAVDGRILAGEGRRGTGNGLVSAFAAEGRSA